IVGMADVLTYFFFQAEDGIRVFHVTGVQTCALPISSGRLSRSVRASRPNSAAGTSWTTRLSVPAGSTRSGPPSSWPAAAASAAPSGGVRVTANAQTRPSGSGPVGTSLTYGLRRLGHGLLQCFQPRPQPCVLLGERVPRGPGRQGRIGLPPVDAGLLRGVHRGDEQTQPDGEQFDVEQIDLDVAGDDDALVQHPFEEIGEAARRRTTGLGRGEVVGGVDGGHGALPGSRGVRTARAAGAVAVVRTAGRAD